MLDITLQDVWEADPKPTLVIELLDVPDGDLDGTRHGFNILYSNNPCQKYLEMLGSFRDESNVDGDRFRRWAVSTSSKTAHTCNSSFDFKGATWSWFDVSRPGIRYRVLSGKAHDFSTNGAHTHPLEDDQLITKRPSIVNKSLRDRLDYVTPELEAQLALIEQADWSQAGFGDISDWPPELLEISRMVLMMPKPAAVIVGSRSLMLYNTAYADDLLGPRHPGAMATPIDDVYPEASQERLMSYERIISQGWVDVDAPYPTFRPAGGVLEERYSTWTMISLGKALNSVFLLSSDATPAVLEQRRQATLAKVRELCVGAPNFPTFCAAARDACSRNPYDISFLRFYSVQPGSDSPEPTLETSLPIALAEEEPESVKELLRNALRAKAPIFLTAAEGSLPSQWRDLAKAHGFECPAERAVVTRLRLGDGANEAYGIVAMGLNIRRHYDQPHQAFVESILHTFTSHSQGAMRRDEEARFRRETAETNATTSLQLRSFARMLEMSKFTMLLEIDTLRQQCFSCSEDADLSSSWSYVVADANTV